MITRVLTRASTQGIDGRDPAHLARSYLGVSFARSAASRQAGQEALRRMHARTEDRDTATTWATREAQYDAVCTWGIPDHALLQRVSAIGMPGRAAELTDRLSERDILDRLIKAVRIWGEPGLGGAR
jgi:hypothetical protein